MITFLKSPVLSPFKKSSYPMIFCTIHFAPSLLNILFKINITIV